MAFWLIHWKFGRHFKHSLKVSCTHSPNKKHLIRFSAPFVRMYSFIHSVRFGLARVGSLWYDILTTHSFIHISLSFFLNAVNNLTVWIRSKKVLFIRYFSFCCCFWHYRSHLHWSIDLLWYLAFPTYNTTAILNKRIKEKVRKILF